MCDTNENQVNWLESECCIDTETLKCSLYTEAVTVNSGDNLLGLSYLPVQH